MVQGFSKDWAQNDAGEAEMQIVVAFDIVTLDNGGIGVALKTVETKNHYDEVEAGTRQPHKVQLFFQTPFARQFAVGLHETAKRMMAATGKPDN